MPDLGYWGDMPIDCGGGLSIAENVYVSLRDGMGDAHSRDDATNANAERRCIAKTLADAQHAQRRGTLQSTPATATDLLSAWEQRLGAPVNPSDPAHIRRAVCTAILQSAGVPTNANIAAACSTALAGESVTVSSSKRNRPIANLTPITLGTTPVFRVVSGGGLNAGAHSLQIGVDTGTSIQTDGNTYSVVIPSAGSSILVGQIGPLPAGAVARYYLSTAAGASGCALVATGNGGAIVLSQYPINPAQPGLHHYAIVVSSATAHDPVKRSKLHAVLGTMLPAHATYDIVASSPFVLGTATTAGASTFDRGGL